MFFMNTDSKIRTKFQPMESNNRVRIIYHDQARFVLEVQS